MTQEQFIEAMREHIKWRRKKGGKQADFTGESLCDIDFSVIDLQDDDPHPIPIHLSLKPTLRVQLCLHVTFTKQIFQVQTLQV